MTERLDPYEIFAEDDDGFDVTTLFHPAPAEPAPFTPPLSAAERQHSCAACGAAFGRGERTEVEVLLDGEVRYVAVHPGHSTYAPQRERLAAAKLRGVTAALDEAA